ncbi:MAG: 50S ribosomal protein L21 [Patescibacteria group bacterium]
MKYAVLSISGRQVKVAEGDVFKVNKANDLTPKVLFYSDGKIQEVGNPYLSDIRVELEVLKAYKGDKITIRRFKAKSRYHKIRGFRPLVSDLKVISIVKAGEKPAGAELAVTKETPSKVKKVRKVKKV